MKRLSFFLALLCLALCGFTLQSSFDGFLRRIEVYKSLLPQQKIYVQFDKPAYGNGETIWFNAFLVDAASHRPDTSATVVYAELFSPGGKMLQRRILPVQKGCAAGDFQLGDSLAQGRYVVRAYTHYMKNLGEDFFFVKELDVYNPENSVPLAKDTASQRPDVQFFPEGGNLLTGVDNRVAFKITSPDNGQGLSAEGEILDENNVAVAAFKTEHKGMGSFSFKPQSGKTYTARLKGYAGTSYFVPVALDRGLLLRVDEAGKDLRVIVYNNSADTNRIYFVAQTRGIVCYALKSVFTKSYSFKVPKSSFPTGIAQLTVFDQNYRPLCERLFFINQKDQLQCSVAASKAVFKARETVALQISVHDKDHKPVAGRFSLSTYDQKVPETDSFAADINSYLLLSSDLKGRIEAPGYYFKDTLRKTAQHLDLLMLVQGWRRYNWADLMKDLPLPIKLAYYPEKNLVISGKVMKTFSKKPAPDSRIKILTKAGDMLITQTDANGIFYANGIFHYDTTTVTIQTDNAKGKKTDLKLVVDPFSPSPLNTYQALRFSSPPAESFATQNNHQNILKNRLLAKSILLKEVEIKSQKKKQEENANAVFKPYGTADYAIKASDIPAGYFDILSALQGRVPGIQIYPAGPDTRVSIRGGGEPLFLIDGMPVPIDVVLSLPVGMVETIDVLTNAGSTGVYGGRGGNGVIAIYTKRGGGYTGETFGITSFSYPGFYKAKTFYVPKYEGDEKDLPDLRSTLFWSPMVVTDSTGSATVSFPASDVLSTYKIVVEGISSQGATGRGTATFKVE